MTRFKPTLRVQRLRIERLGTSVYDEVFHQGVNIIRGDNSSGKSTILNFLYYSIGGDISDWSQTALLCTRVLVEVSLNG
ncbi:AAA family ATPase [Bradyrhizobium sp. AUGA SZCCT0274]|nr:AAA family ATPase [Bradyrhizobium sp. AUGA SZCCT0274]